MNLNELIEIINTTESYKKEYYLDLVKNKLNNCEIESFRQYNFELIYLFDNRGIRHLEIIKGINSKHCKQINEIFKAKKTIDGLAIENLKYDLNSNLILQDNAFYYVKNDQWLEVRFWTLLIEKYWKSNSKYNNTEEEFLFFSNRYNKFNDFFNWLKSPNPTEDELYTYFRWNLVSVSYVLSDSKIEISVEFEKNRYRELYDEINISADYLLDTGKIELKKWSESFHNYK